MSVFNYTQLDKGRLYDPYEFTDSDDEMCSGSIASSKGENSGFDGISNAVPMAFDNFENDLSTTSTQAMPSTSTQASIPSASNVSNNLSSKSVLQKKTQNVPKKIKTKEKRVSYLSRML